MKKNPAWLLILTLLFSLVVVGCQSEPDMETDEGDGETSAEQVTIEVWDFGGSEFAWMDNIVIPAFEEKYPNIKVEHIGVIEDEFALKLETAIAADDTPDLAIFPPARVIAAGHVLPLDDFMARDGISRDDFSPLFAAQNVFTGGEVEDKVIALPVSSNLWGMVYNKDLFAEAGLPELGPDDRIDFDTWLEYARAINKPADNLEDRIWGSAMFHPVFNAANNNMSDPFILGEDGRTCAGNANNADWLHAWEVLYTAYAEDLTPESAGAMIDESQQDEMFGQGKVGMTYGTLGDALFARDQGLNVGITGQPVVTPGHEGNAGGWNDNYGIMAATEHPEEAWTFLKYLSTEATLNVPFGADMLESSGETSGISGLPGYLPLHEEGQFAEQIANDPLVADAAAVMDNIIPAPFTVDTWTSLDEFWNIFSMVEDEGMTVEEAVNQATETCQQVTDQLWETFDSFSE